MSRKPHEPTDALRQTVKLHTTGTTQETIAQIIGQAHAKTKEAFDAPR
jgi:hypothetical protein